MRLEIRADAKRGFRGRRQQPNAGTTKENKA